MSLQSQDFVETRPLTATEPLTSKPHLFVVLPAYNEERGICELLDCIGESLSESGWSFQVVLVDDGSEDRTADLAEQYALQMPIRVLRHGTNRGLGVTLRDGLMEASSSAEPRDVIITMDADNTHPVGLIDEMVQRLRQGSDVVIASRFRDGSQVIGVPWNRQMLSYGARFLFTLFFPTKGVRDYTCGFRAYRASVLHEAFTTYGKAFVEEAGFSCMVDVLLKLRSQGAVFTEVPMILRYDEKRGDSKMRVLKTVGRTFSLLLRRRFHSEKR